LAERGLLEQTVVYQGADYLQRLKQLEPRIRAMPPLRDAKELDRLAAEVHPFAVDVRWGALSADLIRRCHELQIQVFSDALGINERIESYRRAIEWGIDTIQTDHPLRVIRAIELSESESGS
jgi:glycerophosphoryl diester phosphodiesterase